MNNSPTPSPFEVSQAPSPRSKAPIIAVTIVIGLLIAIGVAAFLAWNAPGSFAGVWSAATLPQELRSARILTNTGTETVAYMPGMAWFVELPQLPGRAVAFARGGNDLLSIRTDDSGTYTLDQNGTSLFSIEEQIDAPSEAPGTHIVAFSKRVGGMVATTTVSAPAPHTLPPIRPSEWETWFYFPQTKATARIMPGYGPVFIDPDHLFFFAESGIYRLEASSGAAEKVVDTSIPYILGPVLQSPDRSLIAYQDTGKKAMTVYRVQDAMLLPVAEISERLFAPTLGNDGLYDVKGTTQGAEVWKYGFDGTAAKHIHTFPYKLGVSRLSF